MNTRVLMLGKKPTTSERQSILLPGGVHPHPPYRTMRLDTRFFAFRMPAIRRMFHLRPALLATTSIVSRTAHAFIALFVRK